MPAETPTFNTTLCEESQALADKWAAAAAEEGELADPEEAKFAAWPSPQKVLKLLAGRYGIAPASRMKFVVLLMPRDYFRVNIVLIFSYESCLVNLVV